MSLTTIILTLSITLISIILTAIISRHYAMRSKLYFIIYSIVDLVKLSRIAKDKVQILYNAQPVDSLSVIRIVIENHGYIDISKDQMRSKPKIKFINSAKVIDIEEVDKNVENEIIPEIDLENNEIYFDLIYIKRKEKTAFQILVHKEKGEPIEYKDLTFYKGTIKNTDVRFLNLEAVRFPKYVDNFFEILRKHPKIITIFYIGFSLYFLFKGISYIIYSIVNFNIYDFIGLDTPEKISISLGILFIFTSFTVLFPILWLYRRLKYRTIFYKKNNKTN